MDIISRLARESDLLQIFKANVGLSGKIIDEELLPNYVHEHRMFCAEVDKKIVSVLYWENNFLGNQNFWLIRQVTTVIDWRRKGVASEIIRAFLKYAATQSIKKVFSDVRQNNKGSINLNKKLGAIECGQLKGLDDDSNEDGYDSELDVWKIYRFDLK